VREHFVEELAVVGGSGLDHSGGGEVCGGLQGEFAFAIV
jgi:hypothetical protein